MLPHPCILGDPQSKRGKSGSGCLTLAFSGAQKRAEMLPHPCILGHPQTKGDNSEVATSHVLSEGPQQRAEMLCLAIPENAAVM